MQPSVIHVIPHLWSGAGAVLTRLCEEQAAKGAVTIVTAGSGGDQPDWKAYRSRLKRADVTHHTIDFYNRSQDNFWTSASQLAELIRELKPAVIHAHAGVPACGAVVARDISGHRARVIGQMYSWGPGRPEWMNRQDMWGFSQADRVVCSAYAYRDLLIRYGVPARKLVYLPWGLPLEDLPWRGHRAAASVAVAPVIGFIGRIEPRKGQLQLVRAFASVRKRFPGARLELVGPVADERYAAAIRAQIAKAKLGNAVSLIGSVPDVRVHLRTWDLFVSLSSDEGQGMAVLEAMATGVPVLARPVAGISDFLSDGRTGFAVTKVDTASIADRMVGALLSPSRLQTAARGARRLVQRRYDWRQTVAAFERVYGAYGA